MNEKRLIFYTIFFALAGAGVAFAAGAPSRLFDVIDASQSGQVIGQVRLDGNHRLSVVSASPEGARLKQIAAEMNDKAMLHMEAMPPRGSRPYARMSRPIRRGDADYEEAQSLYLAKYFDLSLREVGRP